jgi:hypothetical protein
VYLSTPVPTGIVFIGKIRWLLTIRVDPLRSSNPLYSVYLYPFIKGARVGYGGNLPDPCCYISISRGGCPHSALWGEFKIKMRVDARMVIRIFCKKIDLYDRERFDSFSTHI